MQIRHWLVSIVGLVLLAPTGPSTAEPLFQLDARMGAVNEGRGSGSNVIDLIDTFLSQSAEFGPLALLVGYEGRLNYLGIPEAIQFDVSNFGRTARLTIPLTQTEITFNGADPDAVADQVEDWIKQEGSSQWADFMRRANALTPLAVTSGNPKSTVALMGDGAYRRFGSDNSRSRFGFEQGSQRIGGLELRVDVGASNITTDRFKNDLYTVDPTISLIGSIGRYVGISGSVIGQYRDYNGGQIFDLGLEIGIPITLSRPDRSEWFWQITPVVQAAAGASIDLAAGGLFVGGSLVHSLGYNNGVFEFGMANSISYYGGIPVDDIDGYDFDTKLSQLYFKNGLEATWHAPWGFYVDGGVHFTNFAIDEAAVPWFATPAIGIGWRAGRWVDLRIAYEADLGEDDYVSNNLQGKLSFLF